MELSEKIEPKLKISVNKMELNEKIELKSKNFHELELDDRILKVKPIR